MACLICFMAVIVPPGMMPMSASFQQNSQSAAYDPVLQQLGFKLVICGWPQETDIFRGNGSEHQDHFPADTHQICLFSGQLSWQMPLMALLLPLSLQSEQVMWSFEQLFWFEELDASHLARAPPLSSQV